MAVIAKPMTVKLDPDTRTRIESLADARQRTTHWMLREAVTQYVEREEKREAIRQGAISAWNTYQDSGLHLTLTEADNWLAQLEAGQDVEPPECHG